MTHLHPYRPQIPQTAAALIRVDTRDTRRCMNPLTGIWPACATTPGYRHASPNGESRAAACVHCSLYIVHCSIYTFSAKERDPETGLSYFGSRYYSSDLSIWLSVDPMAGKYPSLSPYVYCANNPVRVVDPNGCELWKPDKKGNLVAQQNDNAYSLAQYLNTTTDIAIRMLEEQNYTVNENGVLNLKVDDVFHVDYGYCRTRMDYIGATGEFIGSLSKLGLGEDIFGNYWLGLGDVELTGAQFAGILMYIKDNNPNTSNEQNVTLKGASGKTYPGKSKVVDFYGSPYERLFGRATLYYNTKGNIVGFYDEYNFDSKPWGTRSFKNEMITRSVNFVSPKCSSSVSIRYGYSKR